MSQQTHIKTNTHKIFLVIFFLLVFAFGFGKGEKAEAGTYLCYCQDTGTQNKYQIDSCEGTEETCKDTCNSECKGKNYEFGFTVDNSDEEKKEELNESYSLSSYETHKGGSDACDFDFSEYFSPTAWFNCTLLTILQLLGKLLAVSFTLFSWVTNPQIITDVISNQVIYKTWAMVRDILNVLFIMFLLFSAFATVFQVDKYSYKKTLLMIVIMALLVNFSFPIARFIIDVSNMLMYYFIDALEIASEKESGEWLMTITRNTDIDKIVSTTSTSTSYLLSAVIFMFVLVVTLLTISILLVIRVIALAILVIFSSLAFVGTAIPPMASYASDWWKKLFNYAFFGPIMIFMIYIALAMMNEITILTSGDITKLATEHTNDPSFIADLSLFVIPIILLWLGLGVAQSMSIAGASMVVGKAQGFMKGAGKWTAGAPWKVAKMSGIPGGAQAGWKNFRKTGKLFGGKVPLYGGSDAQEAREAKFGGVFKDGRKGWTEAKVELERTRANKLRKDWKDQGAIDKDSVYKKLKSTNPTEQKAAALEIAENHSFESYEQFKKASTAIGNDPVFKKIFDDKAKEKHINFVAKAKIEEKETETGKSLTNNEKQDIYNEHFDKLDNKKWASQINLMPKDEKGEPLEESKFVKEYIKENIASHYPTHQDIFKNLKGANKKQWADAGLAPTEKRNSDETSQSARSYEDIQRELKQKNQERIDNENEFKQSHEDIQKERVRKAQEEINKQNI